MREFLTPQEYTQLRNIDKILKVRKGLHALIVLGADTKELSNELERYFTSDGVIETYERSGAETLAELIKKPYGKTHLTNIYRAKESDKILEAFNAQKQLIAKYDIELIIITDKKSYETLRDEYPDFFSISSFTHLFTEPSIAPSEAQTKTNAKSDVDSLFLAAKNARSNSDIGAALEYYKKALDLCETEDGGHRKDDILDHLESIYSSKEHLGKVLKHQEEALKNSKQSYLQKAINTAENIANAILIYKTQNTASDAPKLQKEPSNEERQIKRKHEEATQLGNIGQLYQDKGDLAKALEYQKEALEMYKRIGYLRGTAEQLGNIGLTYINKGDLDRALEYQKEALKTHKKAGYMQGVAGASGNIGVIYQAKKDFDTAMYYHNEALEISREIRYLYGMASALGNIGLIYHVKNDFDKALRYQKESLAIFKELGNKQDVAKLLTNIAVTHEAEGGAKIAQTYLNEAEQIKQEIGAKMITNIEISPLKEQKYINPVTIKYTLGGKDRVWEAVKNLDSVAVLLYHTKKDAFLLVRQFRAPILLNSSKSIEEAHTYELCAGMCDKDKSLEETVSEEIDEECGYRVSPESIEKITAFHTCVGISGTYQSLFYAEIDESMRVHKGGGDDTEDIELVYIPTKEAKAFALDLSKPKTPGVGLAIFWWFDVKSRIPTKAGFAAN